MRSFEHGELGIAQSQIKVAEQNSSGGSGLANAHKRSVLDLLERVIGAFGVVVIFVSIGLAYYVDGLIGAGLITAYVGIFVLFQIAKSLRMKKIQSAQLEEFRRAKVDGTNLD